MKAILLAGALSLTAVSALAAPVTYKIGSRSHLPELRGRPHGRRLQVAR